MVSPHEYYLIMHQSLIQVLLKTSSTCLGMHSALPNSSMVLGSMDGLTLLYSWDHVEGLADEPMNSHMSPML